MSVEQLVLDRLGVLARPLGGTPAYLREYARQQYAKDSLDFLARVADGTETFREVVVMRRPGGGQVYEVVDVSAPAAVRVRAAEVLLGIGIPRQVGIVDDQDRPTGIIALPPLLMSYAQQVDPSGQDTLALPPHPDGLTYVISEESMNEPEPGQERGADAAPPVPVPGLNPDLVAEIRRRARNGGNGA